MGSVLTALPTRCPPVAFHLRVVHVKQQKERASALRLWYAEALPTNVPATGTLTRRPDWHKSMMGHDVSIGEGVWSAADFERYLDSIRSGVMTVGTFQFPVCFRPRPPLLLTQESQDHALVPDPQQCAWLYELWDDQKNVMNLQAHDRDALTTRINQHVRSVLGVDLQRHLDRIGNMLVFVPTGVRMKAARNAVTDEWVVQTDLRHGETSGYDVQVEFFDAQGVLDAQQVSLSNPSACVPNRPQASGFRYALWRDGRLVYRSGLNGINFSIGVHHQMVVGMRRGVTYTSSDEQLPPDEDPWVHWPRRRRVRNDAQRLAERLELKFYVPRKTDGKAAKREARTDLKRLLKEARHSVRIWDPYFGTGAEDLDLIEAVTDLTVKVRILTSSDDWRGPNERTPTSSAPSDPTTRCKACEQARSQDVQIPFLERLGTQLRERGRALPERWRSVGVKAWVRSGETAFHDRFIILDQEDPSIQRVWSLGSSVNGLGNKHSMLMRVSLPEMVIVAFEDLWGEREELPWGQLLEVYGGS